MQPLFVISTVFNPRRFESRYKLYKNFAKWVKDSGAKLLTVEIAFGDRPFEITENNNPFNIQLRTRHEIWHKERALNIGLSRLCELVHDWKYVAWMDADIKLVRDDWDTEAIHLLQHYAIIQMFGEASSMGPDHHVIFTSKSILRNFEEHSVIDWYDHPGLTFRDITKKNYTVRAGHPGLAWAFRREELQDVGGWLDTCVNGSADLHMAGCYTGKSDLALPTEVSAGYRNSILRYGELCEFYIRRNVSYMPGAAHHYWHGRPRQRGYEERGGCLIKYQFDPHTDLIKGLNGLWKWNLADSRVRDMAIATRKSLASRNEDGNEL